VCVVESERSKALVLSEWLSDQFGTTVETSGEGGAPAGQRPDDVVVVSQGLSDMRTREFLEWLRADDNDCRVVPLTDGGVVTDYEGRSFGRALEWLLHPGELRGAADEMARIPGMEPPALEPVTA